MTPKPGTPTKTPAKKPPRRPATELIIYQLRIELQGIAPAIHRTLLVPGTLSLPKLHYVIQAAMGWDDAHLHDFSIGGQRYGEPDPDFPEVDVLDERRHTVGEVLGQATQRFTYTYDFGDGWEHAVKVEKRLPAVEGRTPGRCASAGRMPVRQRMSVVRWATWTLWRRWPAPLIRSMATCSGGGAARSIRAASA